MTKHPKKDDTIRRSIGKKLLCAEKEDNLLNEFPELHLIKLNILSDISSIDLNT